MSDPHPPIQNSYDCCPKCGYGLSEIERSSVREGECPHCGVVIEKYLAWKKSADSIPPTPGPTRSIQLPAGEEKLIDEAIWHLPPGQNYVRASLKHRISAVLYDSFTIAWLTVLLATIMIGFSPFVFWDSGHPENSLVLPQTYLSLFEFVFLAIVLTVQCGIPLRKEQSLGQKAVGISLVPLRGGDITLSTWILRIIGQQEQYHDQNGSYSGDLYLLSSLTPIKTAAYLREKQKVIVRDLIQKNALTLVLTGDNYDLHLSTEEGSSRYQTNCTRNGCVPIE